MKDLLTIQRQLGALGRTLHSAKDLPSQSQRDDAAQVLQMLSADVMAAGGLERLQRLVEEAVARGEV